MLLVDKDIKTFIKNDNHQFDDNTTAIFHGSTNPITSIGYDLTTECVYKNSKKKRDSCVLKPQDSCFVKSVEEVQFDKQTAGIVKLKNGRIRMGLSLESPVYQPGHHTAIFFRLTNLSDKEITISAGDQYAMLMFERLSDEPEHPYNGAFQDESNYIGIPGRYSSIYEAQMKALTKKQQSLKSIEKNLYANVITILTIFIGIFTLLNVNIELAKDAADASSFIKFNLACIGSIGFLSSLMNEIIGERIKHHGLWLIPLVCFIVLMILIIV